MGNSPIGFKLTNANYITPTPDKVNVESLNLANITTTPWEGGNLAVGVGVNEISDINKNSSKIQTKPAFEARLTQMLNPNDEDNGMFAYLRYQNIGGVSKERMTLGGKASFGKDDKHTISVASHLSYNGTNLTSGGWFGYSYKVNEHLSLWAELQKNWNFEDKNKKILNFPEGEQLLNFGVTYNF